MGKRLNSWWGVVFVWDIAFYRLERKFQSKVGFRMYPVFDVVLFG